MTIPSSIVWVLMGLSVTVNVHLSNFVILRSVAMFRLFDKNFDPDIVSVMLVIIYLLIISGDDILEIAEC